MENRKNATPLVSVIVPAYNAEKYIKECIDSLQKQDYRNLEIIVVDDGSDDSTLVAIKEKMRLDGRIKLIRQEHLGPNKARKNGIDSALGEYIMFVDADDYIDECAVSKIVNAFLDHRVDAVRFNAKRPHEKNDVPLLDLGEKGTIEHDKIIDLLLNTYTLNSLCLQAYRTKDLANIRALKYDLDFGEDFLINLEVHMKTKAMFAMDDILYYYRENQDSTTHKKEYGRVLKNIADRVFVSCRAMEFAMNLNTDLKNKAIYNQTKMIKGVIMDITKVRGYDSRTFAVDLQKALREIELLKINLSELEEYMKDLNMTEKMRHRGMIRAILRVDCKYICSHIRTYAMIERIHA